MIKRLVAATVFAVTLQFAAAAPTAVFAHTESTQNVSTAMIESAATIPSNSCQYVVRPGDTLSRISPFNWQAIRVPSGNPNLIFPGQVLNLCMSGNTPPPPAPVFGPVHFVNNSYWAAGEFCTSPQVVTGPISQWTVPPGCYAGIYRPNPANFVYRGGFGWCNWWPEVLHPTDPNILNGTRHGTPIPGAMMVFAPGEQGASPVGHYAQVVSVLGNGWLLISEMNDSWRGAGFGLVNYRYVRVTGGTSFIYN